MAPPAQSLLLAAAHRETQNRPMPGIPWLRFIRKHLGARVRFWPFDVGALLQVSIHAVLPTRSTISNSLIMLWYLRPRRLLPPAG